MLEAMKIAAKKKIVVSCHCEDSFLAESARPFRKAALELLSKENISPAEKKEAANNLRKADSLLACAEDTATFRNLRHKNASGKTSGSRRRRASFNVFFLSKARIPKMRVHINK